MLLHYFVLAFILGPRPLTQDEINNNDYKIFYREWVLCKFTTEGTNCTWHSCFRAATNLFEIPLLNKLESKVCISDKKRYAGDD